MKPIIAIHRNSVDALRKIGFRINDARISKCEFTGDLELYVSWTADDEHVYSTNYADRGDCSIGGSTYAATEIRFEGIDITNYDCQFPIGTEYAMMTMGIEDLPEDTYTYSHVIFEKREAYFHFSKINTRWSRYKFLSLHEIDPFLPSEHSL